jgi:hypothetical protein
MSPYTASLGSQLNTFINISSFSAYWRVAGTTTWNWIATGTFNPYSPSGFSGDINIGDCKPGQILDIRYDLKDISMPMWGTTSAFSLYTSYLTPTATTGGFQT